MRGRGGTCRGPGLACCSSGPPRWHRHFCRLARTLCPFLRIPCFPPSEQKRGFRARGWCCGRVLRCRYHPRFSVLGKCCRPRLSLPVLSAAVHRRVRLCANAWPKQPARGRSFRTGSRCSWSNRRTSPSHSFARRPRCGSRNERACGRVVRCPWPEVIDEAATARLRSGGLLCGGECASICPAARDYSSGHLWVCGRVSAVSRPALHGRYWTATVCVRGYWRCCVVGGPNAPRRCVGSLGHGRLWVYGGRSRDRLPLQRTACGGPLDLGCLLSELFRDALSHRAFIVSARFAASDRASGGKLGVSRWGVASTIQARDTFKSSLRHMDLRALRGDDDHVSGGWGCQIEGQRLVMGRGGCPSRADCLRCAPEGGIRSHVFTAGTHHRAIPLAISAPCVWDVGPRAGGAPGVISPSAWPLVRSAGLGVPLRGVADDVHRLRLPTVVPGLPVFL